MIAISSLVTLIQCPMNCIDSHTHVNFTLTFQGQVQIILMDHIKHQLSQAPPTQTAPMSRELAIQTKPM